MKKTVKKLTLAKETVRSLSAFDLLEAAGGTTWQATCAGCGTNGGDSCRYCLPQPETRTCWC